MNPMSKAKPGFEDEFREVFLRIEVAQGNREPIERKGFLGRMFAAKEDPAPLIERFQEISIPPFQAIGAPVVGTDTAADDWVRRLYSEGRIESVDSEAAAISAMTGYHVMEIMPECDGFPIYTHDGLYEGVTRASFRGAFLNDCQDVIGDDLHGQAWMAMLADELAAWGRGMRICADEYADKQDVAHVLGDRTWQWTDENAPEAKAHIIDQAARWALWWSDRGHGSEPYF